MSDTTTTETRTWQAGDTEPAVGTTVIRADGVRTTRYELGWSPGPFNWIGITSLGEVRDATPVNQTRYEVIETPRETAARLKAAMRRNAFAARSERDEADDEGTSYSTDTDLQNDR